MMMRFFSTKILVTFLLLSLHLRETQCSSRNHKLYELQKKLEKRMSKTSSPTQVPSPTSTKSNGRVFYPIGYGADPTGAQDSTDPILAAINDAVTLKNGENLLPGVNDLGGATIDLQGGSFVISSPIRFPPAIGNIVFIDDDKKCYLEINYTFDIQKEWAR